MKAIFAYVAYNLCKILSSHHAKKTLIFLYDSETDADGTGEKIQ
jgi:hypothetical protein